MVYQPGHRLGADALRSYPRRLVLIPAGQASMQGTPAQAGQEDLKDWTTVHSPGKLTAHNRATARAADRPVGTAPAAKHDGAAAVPAAAAPSSAAERLKARLASRRGPGAASVGAATSTGAGRRAATEAAAPLSKLKEEAVGAPTPGMPQPASVATALQGNPRQAVLQSKPAGSEAASKVAQETGPAAAAGQTDAEPPPAQPAALCAEQVKAEASAAGPSAGVSLSAGEAAATATADSEIEPADNGGAAGQRPTAKGAASVLLEPDAQPARPAAAREAERQGAWGWSTFVQGAMRDVQQLRETLLQVCALMAVCRKEHKDWVRLPSSWLLWVPHGAVVMWGNQRWMRFAVRACRLCVLRVDHSN